MRAKNILLIIVFFLISASIFNSLSAAELENEFSIVVYGGEPEGVMAAVAAARQGYNTLLLMERDKPGGLMTYGGLNFLDLNYGPDQRNLNKGIFAEWHHMLANRVVFSIDAAEKAFEKLIFREENLTVYSGVTIKSLQVNDGMVKEIIVSRNSEDIHLYPSMLIDASQDADLAAIAGADYFTGGADIGLPERHMALTMVLHLGNVNGDGIMQEVRSQRYGLAHMKDDHAWGFVRVGELYQPLDNNIRMRGLNIVMEKDKQSGNYEVYINSMLIFDTDPLDKKSISRAYNRGKREAANVLEFLKTNFRGFEKAEIIDYLPELYVRESRHVVARYQLKITDLFNNRVFNDTIALGSYPLDYQASGTDNTGYVLFNPIIYGIPLRSLLPHNFKNMMVVGRSSGFSSLAASSSRVLPTGMACGEAAGIAAAYALENNKNIPELITDNEMINSIQQELGLDSLLKIYSKETNKEIIEDQVLLPYLEELISWGLLNGGYNNDFKLKSTITERHFAHKIAEGLIRRQADILYEWVPGGLESVSSTQSLTRNQAAKLLLVAASKSIEGLSGDEYYHQAISNELIPDYIIENIRIDRVLNRREAYIILGSFLKNCSTADDISFYRGYE
ncbi:FAD-dependent oxidoreductase [Iocasia frigidifontis]|uniref:FAD-dependent oxidoreductase n=1 Tax=Iocasia fonsfrigidae TaxID=2682810 RepID=A0A8A7K9F4_9FIRM|nr:FAD-dependent oxidoreductase [Iocasia fonsfrigidae]QTL98386.1 FAD-dependent oxidoreductase [Iocasia fonsfrigidae]